MALTVLRRNKVGKDVRHSFFLISDDGETRNLPYNGVLNALKANSVEFTNVCYDTKAGVKGLGGSLDRYPLVEFNSLEHILSTTDFSSLNVVNGTNLIILGQYSDGNFRIANLAGLVRDMTESELVAYASNNKGDMCNAKVMSGRLRPISGTKFRGIAGKSSIKSVGSSLQGTGSNKVSVGNNSQGTGSNKVSSGSNQAVGSGSSLQGTGSNKVSVGNNSQGTGSNKVSSGSIAGVSPKRDANAITGGDVFVGDTPEEMFEYAKNKLEAEAVEYTKKVEEEKAERDARTASINSNYKLDNSYTVESGGKTYNLDENTARELKRAVVTGRSKMAYIEMPEERVDVGNVVDNQSLIAQAQRKKSINTEEKLILAATTLKYIDPFVYAAYQSLEVVYLEEEQPPLKTMGVSDDKIYIVLPALLGIELPQLSWLLLHEISHIIMQHHVRLKNRDPQLFNIACDLFVNKTIDVNYGCKPGTPVQKMLYHNVAPVGLQFHAEYEDAESLDDIKVSVYCDDIDITKETVESIYEALVDENGQGQGQQGGQQGNQQGGHQGNSQGQQGQQGQGNSQGQQGQGSQQDGQGQSNGGQGQGQGQGNGQGQGQANGQGQQGQGQGQDNGQGQGQGQDNSQGQQGQGQQGQGQQGQGQQGQGQQGQGQQGDDWITYKGQKIAKRSSNSGIDMVEDKDTDSHGSTQEQREAFSRSLVQKISQRSQLYDPNGNSPMSRMASEALLKDFVWTNFVKRFLTKLAEEDWSYRKPNRKQSTRAYIAKGKSKSDLSAEEAVYVCIDVSGSVSDDDLYKAFSYIELLLRKLDLTGFVLFWSTQVNEPIPFKNSRELVKIRDAKAFDSTGGTDPTCVFKFFKSKACKKKPNLVIMITDGYFSPLERNMKPRCETLWIITDNTRNYRELNFSFGKVAPLIPKK